MKSLSELFATIMSIPCVDKQIKVRAGYLQSKLCGTGRGFGIGNLFGFAR